MSYKRINWTNTSETPLNANNLNKMDTGIYNNQSSITALEKLVTYPNLAVDCLKGNYSATNGAVLTVYNSCLNIIQEDASTTVLKSDLSDIKVIDKNRLMLIKLCIRMTSGSNLSIYFKYRTDNDELYVIKDSIVASNLNISNIGNPSYIITDNEYHNVWCIFNNSDVTEITGIAVELAPFAKVEISSLQAFYSLDKTSSGGAIITDSNIVTTALNYYVTATIASNLEIIPTTYTEGEI